MSGERRVGNECNEFGWRFERVKEVIQGSAWSVGRMGGERQTSGRGNE